LDKQALAGLSGGWGARGACKVRALLGDVTKDDDTIAALVNAFETHGLTLGSTRRAPTDHLGRFRKPEQTAALTNFDQSLRDKVIAVLQKVGGIAHANCCRVVHDEIRIILVEIVLRLLGHRKGAGHSDLYRSVSVARKKATSRT
jgi:hypothetical protein